MYLQYSLYFIFREYNVNYATYIQIDEEFVLAISFREIELCCLLCFHVCVMNYLSCSRFYDNLGTIETICENDGADL